MAHLTSSLRSLRTLLLVLTTVTGLLLGVAMAGVPAAEAGSGAIRKKIVKYDEAFEDTTNEVPTVDFRKVTAKRVGDDLRVDVKMGAVRPYQAYGYFHIDFKVNRRVPAEVRVGYHEGFSDYRASVKVEGRVACRLPVRLYVNRRTSTYTISAPLRCLGPSPRVITFTNGFSDGSLDDGSNGRDEIFFSEPSHVLDVR